MSVGQHTRNKLTQGDWVRIVVEGDEFGEPQDISWHREDHRSVHANDYEETEAQLNEEF